MELGVQLFGCSRLFREDPEAFFDQMQQIGYTQIEPCILFDGPGESDLAAAFGGLVWSPAETAVFKKSMDRRGLKLFSAHAFCTDPVLHQDEMLQLAAENGITAYVFNLPAARETLPAFIGKLTQLAEALGSIDCEVWLHNVRGDFAESGQSSPFETALAFGPQLFAQIDSGWAMFDGRDPAGLIAALSERLHGLHIKDMDRDYSHRSGDDIFAVLGEGATDLPALLQNAGDVRIVIDQDVSKADFVEDLRRSLAAVKAACGSD